MLDRRRETYEELQRADHKRRRRWRRAWGIIALLLVLLVAVRVWWGAVAQRRLDAVIERYRAAGEPILIADFAPTQGVADSRNAALVYQDAFIAVVTPTGVEVRGEYFVDDSRLAFAYPQDSRRWVEANDPVLALLCKADALPECDWGMRFTSPLYLQVLGTLRWVRNFQKTLCALAVAQHVVGDDAASVETLLHVERINEQFIAPRESSIIPYFIAAACESLMCHRISVIAPRLRVTDSGAVEEESPLKPVPRARVQSLIAELLDDEAWNMGWRSSINGERALILDYAGTLPTGAFTGAGIIGGSGPVAARVVDALIGPTFRLDAARGLESMTRLREAGLLDTYPAAKRATLTAEGAGNPFDDATTILEQASRVLALQGSRSSDLGLMPHFRLRAERRMAATALAIRLYELDHGRRPAALNDLVPDYLAAVPVDPFAEPARPLAYLPGHDPPILYSIYEDGIDDGGAEPTSTEHERSMEWKGDWLFYLDGDRPADPIRWENVLVNPPKSMGGSADED
ncbi:MAG: hypothetical protein IT449_04235 [Phycisphaerales bacterium]|nr:hypothetical protein [Phycisphaerales bacterium]